MNSVGMAERRNTPSATDPCSQCETPSRPWVAITTRSLPCSLRKSTMAWVGSCNLMRMFSTSIPSLLAIVHGGSSSSESPHCASKRCACGNARASAASYCDTCRRCNLLLAAKAIRNAWANAAALKSEKSVGCTMERMAFIAIAHTRTRDHKSMPRTFAGGDGLVKIRSFPVPPAPACIQIEQRRELAHAQSRCAGLHPEISSVLPPAGRRRAPRRALLHAAGGFSRCDARTKPARRRYLSGRDPRDRIHRPARRRPPSGAERVLSRRDPRAARPRVCHAVLHQAQPLQGRRAGVGHLEASARHVLPRARQQRPLLRLVRRVSGWAWLHRSRAQPLPRQHVRLDDRLPREQALATPARHRPQHQLAAERPVLGQVHRR